MLVTRRLAYPRPTGAALDCWSSVYQAIDH